MNSESHRNLLRIAWLMLMMSVLVSCDRKGAGTFSVEAVWGDGRPAVPCWIVAEVRQLQKDGPPAVVAAASPVQCDSGDTPDGGAADGGASDLSVDAGASEGLSVDFDEVPHGKDYVVTVAVKAGVEDDARLLRFGVSPVFALSRGDRERFPVVLSRFDLSILGEGEFLDDARADLLLRFSEEMFSDLAAKSALHLSNKADFADAVIAPLSDLVPEPDGHRFEAWDLDRGICDGRCPDGEREVFVRLDNPALKENEMTATARVGVDRTPPALEELPNLPRYAGRDIEMEVRFTEPVVTASLDVDCGGLGAADVESLGGQDRGGVAVGRRYRIVCPVERSTENRDYSLALSASDPAGHSSGVISLGTVTVDTVLSLVDGTIRYAPEVARLGQTVVISFDLTESAEDLWVKIDSTEITEDCTPADATRRAYECRYTVTADDEEGLHTIALSVKDRAANWSGYELEDVLEFDFTVPELVDASIDPHLAQANRRILVELEFSEPIRRLTPDWDGLGFGPLEADPDDPLVYRATYGVSPLAEDRTYTLQVAFEDAAGNGDRQAIGEVTIDTEPPAILGDVTVDRAIANTDTAFTFDFTVSERLSELSVAVGLVWLDISRDCDLDTRTMTYTCTHTVPNGEREGPKFIYIEMTDLAGNDSSLYEENAVIYNYEDPWLVDTAVSPDRASPGSTVIVSLLFSEKVSGVALDWDGLAGEVDPDIFDDRFTLRVDITDETEDGLYDISLLSAMDPAGRVVAAAPLGAVIVDTQAPQIVNDALTVDRTLMKDGDSLNLGFAVSEPLRELTVRIGDHPVSGGFDESCDAALACTLRHVAARDSELEGMKDISVEMVDLAGNTHTALFEQMVTYDFTPPSIKSAGISPSAANDGDELVLTVTLSEEIAGDVIPLAGSGLGFGDLQRTNKPLEFRTTYTVTAGDAQGEYPMVAERLEDLAGNVSTDLSLVAAKIVRIIYVRADAPDGGDGLAWDTALPTLQAGLLAAIEGNQVWVGQGVYRPAAAVAGDADPREATLLLKPGVTVYGGFEGDETAPDQRSLTESSYSVLDGRMELEGGGANAYHVVTVTTDGHLDGFTILNGVADGPVPHEVGGGILVEKGALTLSHCVVKDNTAVASGGGLYGYMSIIDLADTAFSENHTDAEGGAVYTTDSVVRIKRSRFEGNSAAEDGGGISNANSREVTLVSCAFSGNQSTNGYGGAVKNRYATLRMANCVLDGNDARFGGGLGDQRSPRVEILGCTFFDNLAEQAGNGIFFEDNDGDNITLANAIFWSEAASAGSEDCQVTAGGMTGDIGVTYSDMPTCGTAAGVSCAVGCISLDPLFANPSGPGAISFALGPGSPCVDAGSCALMPPDYLDLDDDGGETETLPWDMDGAPRCQGEADMGAFERE